ncbi:MAG: HPr kinase/phosphorylase [Pseudorhodoplanes sp.]
MTAATIHASAVLVGARAVLIRGASGAGKSRLALALLAAPASGRLSFARLIGDDRICVEAAHGRLLVRPAPALAGLIEIRGIGIRTVAFERVGAVGLVVDLAIHAPRLPTGDESRAEIAGVWLPRLAVADGVDPLPVVLARIAADEGGQAGL